MDTDAVNPGWLNTNGPRRTIVFSTLAYLSVMVFLLSITSWFGSSLYADYMTLGPLREHLAQLDARANSSVRSPLTGNTESGSPFVMGDTITQAGATLQQHMEQAVVKAGGILLSSQLDLEDQSPKSGKINLLAELEIAQPALQGFLFDLETGNPYLFVDTLSVQTPQSPSEQEASRLHLSIAVSGQWEARP